MKTALWDVDGVFRPEKHMLTNLIVYDTATQFSVRTGLSPTVFLNLRSQHRATGGLRDVLSNEYDVDIDDLYAGSASRIDYGVLGRPSPEKSRLMRNLPYEHVILTDASVEHARNVVERCIGPGIIPPDNIYSSNEMFGVAKAKLDFGRFLNHLEITAGDIEFFVEDKPKNLEPAHAAGVQRTILVTPSGKLEGAKPPYVSEIYFNQLDFLRKETVWARGQTGRLAGTARNGGGR